MLHDFTRDKLVKFNKQEYVYEWENGSRIQLAHAQWEHDITQYQGAQIPLLIIDEATHFSEKMIRFLRSRVRLGSLQIPEKYQGMFPRIIYASNPGGVGHMYLKKGFVDHGIKLHRAPPSDGGMIRQYIPAKLHDNKILMENDPDYADKLRGLGKEALIDAMLDGNWESSDSVALPKWSAGRNVVSDFNIPSSWTIRRGYDYGFSAPYAVLWYAKANGDDYTDSAGNQRSVPKGSIFIIRELYGADEYGSGIKEDAGDTAVKIAAIDETMWGVKIGPADNSIFDKENGPSISEIMSEKGVEWDGSNKKPGSRVTGLSLLNQMVSEANKPHKEGPCFYVFASCTNTVEQLPNLQLDKDDKEDVDTESEDHIYDVVRYIVLHVPKDAHTLKVSGF
jgi:hypothetical protein